jgi:hypothetical protein
MTNLLRSKAIGFLCVLIGSFLSFCGFFPSYAAAGNDIRLSVGDGHIEASSENLEGLRYIFEGTEFISGGSVSMKHVGRKLEGGRVAYSTHNVWEGVRAHWEQAADSGRITRDIALDLHRLSIRWDIDISECVGFITLYVPERALGQVPYTVEFYDGRRMQDMLWVEPFGAITGIREMVFQAPD